jgi:hypothetical protein
MFLLSRITVPLGLSPSKAEDLDPLREGSVSAHVSLGCASKSSTNQFTLTWFFKFLSSEDKLNLILVQLC